MIAFVYTHRLYDLFDLELISDVSLNLNFTYDPTRTKSQETRHFIARALFDYV